MIIWIYSVFIFFVINEEYCPLFIPLSNLMQIIKEFGCSHWAAALGAFLATFGKNSG